MRRHSSRPSLTQFVVLSILLHGLFILIFGSPTGGSREGRASWGSLDVTIRGPLLDSGVGREAVRAPDLRLPGSEMLERRSRNRDAAKAPPPAAPPEPPRPQPDLEGAKASDVSVPAPLPTIAPLTPATADLAPAPRVDPVKADVPVIAVPAIDWTPRPATEPALSPPVEVARPAPVPVIPTATMQESGTPVLAPSLAPPVEIVPLPRPPVEIPAIAAPPMPHTAIPAAAPSLAPPVDVAPIRPAAPPVATPRPGTPAARDAAPSSRDSPIFDNRRAPSGETPVPGTGPRIDLDAARARAREMAREGTGNRALLPFPMPPLPEKKSKEQLAIEKAWKPDCKDAYKGLGLLAVVPLIANEFGEGNCRW